MPAVVWRPDAQVALNNVVSYISDRDIAAARRMLSCILEAVEPLREHSNLGRIGRAPGTCEIVAHPNYLVIYRVLPTGVDTVDVVYVRRRYP